MNKKKLSSDAEYLKSDELGLVIAKGMAVMYKETPKNPVDFLAKWLLNHSQVQRQAEAVENSKKKVEDHKGRHIKAQQIATKEKEAEAKEAEGR